MTIELKDIQQVVREILRFLLRGNFRHVKPSLVLEFDTVAEFLGFQEDFLRALDQKMMLNYLRPGQSEPWEYLSSEVRQLTFGGVRIQIVCREVRMSGNMRYQRGPLPYGAADDDPDRVQRPDYDKEKP